MSVPPLQPKDRILFVADQACGDPAFCSEVSAHADPDADVYVVAPVRTVRRHRWTSDDTEDRELAKERLTSTLRCLRAQGLRARGSLGDPDAVQAIQDALFAFPADQIVICLQEPELRRWRGKHVVERARDRFVIPITEITIAEREALSVA